DPKEAAKDINTVNLLLWLESVSYFIDYHTLSKNAVETNSLDLLKYLHSLDKLSHSCYYVNVENVNIEVLEYIIANKTGYGLASLKRNLARSGRLDALSLLDQDTLLDAMESGNLELIEKIEISKGRCYDHLEFCYSAGRSGNPEILPWFIKNFYKLCGKAEFQAQDLQQLILGVVRSGNVDFANFLIK